MDINIIKFDKDHKHIADNAFIVCWVLYFTHLFLITTMFEVPQVIQLLYRLSIVAASLIAAYRLAVMWAEDKQDTILPLLLIAVAATYLLVRHDKSLAGYVVMLIAARGASFDRVVKCSLLIGIAIMLAAFAASQIGFIEDLVYIRHDGSRAHAFGMCYITDLEAHVFFLILGYCYLRRGRLNIAEYIIIPSFTLLMFYFVRARNNTICILLFIAATFIYRYVILSFGELTRQRIYKVLGVLCIVFISLCIVTTITFTVIYPEHNELFMKMDTLLSGRYNMGHWAYSTYGPNLFGSDIEEHGAGRTLIFENYFYLDISYVRVLLCKGLTPFIALLLVNLRCVVKCFRQNIYALIILSVIALECTVEHHWSELEYNFFMLMAFAEIVSLDNSTASDPNIAT